MREIVTRIICEILTRIGHDSAVKYLRESDMILL
jgi:hypothetical protein